MPSGASGNNSDDHSSGESDPGKNRRTVTTIETHELWIVRKVVPGIADGAETLVPLEIPQTEGVSLLNEVNDNSLETEDES